MKTQTLLIILMVLFFINNAWAQTEEENFFQQIAELSQGEVDLIPVILQISQQGYDDLDGKHFTVSDYMQIIEEMSVALKPRVDAAKTPQEKVQVINNYIFQERNFLVDRSTLFANTMETVLLNIVLDNKKGSCLGLSLVYLGLGERLGLPLHGVEVPGHFFVRYDDSKEKFNIETTDKGAILPDEYYLKRFFKGDPKYFKAPNLVNREILGVYLSNLGTQYKLRGKEEEAIKILQTALQLQPDSPSIYTNLGNVYERVKDIRKAIIQYKTAISMNPYLCEAHYNLGLAHYLYTQQFGTAKKHGDVALKLGCQMHPRFRKFLLETGQ